MAGAYESLKTNAEKVQVNAVILDAIEHNRGGFTDKLIKASQGKTPDARAANFQFVLDAVRNQLAEDISHLPKTAVDNEKAASHPQSNGQYLGVQREHLLKIKNSIEHGVKDVSNIQNLAHKAQTQADFNDSKIHLPAPVAPYAKLDQAIDTAVKAATAAKAVGAASKVSQHDHGEKALSAEEVRARFEGVKGLGGMMRI